MNVKELKQKLESVPDDYEIYSRSFNAALGNDINWARHITSVHPIYKSKAVMLVGGE